MSIPTNKDIAEVTYNGVTIPLVETGGSDSVFVVEYDETTFEDICDAFQAGKICYFDYLGERFYAFKNTPTNIVFLYIYRGGIKKYAICSSTTGWSEISNDLLLLTENNIVTEITSSSDDTTVPSAKAVYDLVQSSGGGGDNVFNVDYGVTPIADIKGAYDAGKVCQMIYNDSVYYLIFMLDSGTLCYFTSAKHTGTIDVIAVNTNGYQAGSTKLQKTAISDPGNYFTDDTVEGALQELGAAKLNPTTKTSAMTQAVGKDSNGALWTAPSGGGGVSEVFRVNYGTTPFADTYAALQNGKICVTEWIGDVYYCCHWDDDIIVFKFSGNTGVQQLIMCNPSNQWQLLNITLGIDSITGLRSELGNFAEALDGKVSCTDAQVASYGYLKLSDLPVWDGSVV